MRDTPLAQKSSAFRATTCAWLLRRPSAIAARCAACCRSRIRHGSGSAGDAQFGVDFLQLVRFGLRRWDDPLILGSVRLADALLKVDTPYGPCWRRYYDDGYGEHDDGSAYDGSRARAGLAAAHGRTRPLRNRLRQGSAAAARDYGAHGFAGRHAARAGLGWTAHSAAGPRARAADRIGDAARVDACRILKLVASRALGRAFDRPAAVWQRYRGERSKAARAIWSERASIGEIAAGAHSIIALRAPRSCAGECNGWQDIEEHPTTPNSLGLHVLSIDTSRLAAGQKVDFTFRYTPGDRWVGADYQIEVKPGERAAEMLAASARDAPLSRREFALLAGALVIIRVRATSRSAPPNPRIPFHRHRSIVESLQSSGGSASSSGRSGPRILRRSHRDLR